MTTGTRSVPADVPVAVKRMIVTESRLAMEPGELSGEELLNGPLLSVSSLGFLGMLVRLEDELDVELPDDLFVGRTYTVVDDVIDVVAAAVTDERGGGDTP